MSYGHQSCPSCGRRWTPPGPCTNWDAGGECGYREPDKPVVAPALEPRIRPAIPADGYRLRPVSTVGGKVDPRPYLTEARAELARIREAKAS